MPPTIRTGLTAGGVRVLPAAESQHPRTETLATPTSSALERGRTRYGCADSKNRPLPAANTPCGVSWQVSTATRQRLLAVDYVETRGVVPQRLTTEGFYLIAWLKFPMPQDPVPLAALARMPFPR
jgi:hypothetical protein